ncbi:TlpA disulfide reductase family protein [Psychroflexus sp. ALD_RP9]|uniref:TlpA disulfide reductase family protein n=1 Tax=Psychroflexus sp. ALD_RP9 TaxID=2777186 RepID=UPI001A8DCAD4|nr:TlpA disulfide reductase family protein [Psychroflexus sp. ALD_RP9]QSS97118.1 AhpC/TSA family protein [Psychroflexus sp. ALD_RP9]
MHKLFYLAAFSFLIISCQQKSGVDIKGQADFLDNNTEIYLSKLGNLQNIEPVDTLIVENKQFSGSLPEANPEDVYIMMVDGVRGQNLVFINENQPININLAESNLRESEVKAGESNQLMQDYLKAQIEFGKEFSQLNKTIIQARNNKNRAKFDSIRVEIDNRKTENIEYRSNLVDKNPNSIVSLLIISDLFNQKSLPTSEVKSKFESIDPELRNTEFGKTLNKKIAAVNATDIGSVAPKFEGPTPNGDILSLDEALGKVTLVDFWASWCKPCRIENPNIVSVYQDYKDQGFKVLGVSLDKPNQKDRWLKAIKDDNLTWNHVSNLQYWEEPIARLYGISSIPAAFLLDEDGRIIAKNLRGQALRNKVDELLNEEE